ncbi:tRNA1(Val) (adenine(37)-N6)-methyltransferase [Parapedobacter sp.]
MKINTDGVLLAAMVAADFPKRILDVGTGTGVISLMLAQRFPLATIDAIEIDTSPADTARRNFEDSPFASRLTSHAVSLVDFDGRAPYDLIVSNPPFFLRSLQNDDRRKRMARHTDMGFFDELLMRSKRWLAPTGSLQVILPPDLADSIGKKAAEDHGLGTQTAVTIRSFASHPPIRRVVSLGQPGGGADGGDAFKELIIYERHGTHSAAYRELLQPFFLAL